MDSLSFNLQPMVMEDAFGVGQIGKAAFLKDRHTMMKTQGDYDHEKAAQEPFVHWLSVPHRVQCIKAVDSSGKILGYICWGFRGYSRETIPTLNGRGLVAENARPADMLGQAHQTGTASESKAVEPAIEKPSEEETTMDDDKIRRLESITDADMRSWMQRLMPDALMEWGTKIADKDGIFCWVHASDGSQMFYEKHGFEKVGELTVDLDEFATQPAPDNQGIWGQYTFRYMKRLPRAD